MADFWQSARNVAKSIGYSNPFTAGFTGLVDGTGLVTKATDPNIDLVPGVSVTNRPGQTDINPLNNPAPLNRAADTSPSGPLDGAGFSNTVTTPGNGGGGNGFMTPTAEQAAAAEAARVAEARRVQSDPLLKALAALDVTRGNRMAENRGEFDRAKQEYDESDRLDREAKDRQVSQNEGQLTSRRQGAMLNGANLFKSLSAILASMGALNGTGSFLTGEAVRGVTNSALGGAADTFDTNAGMINENWSQAEREQRQRRNDAETLLADKNSNTEADILTNRQKILTQLANLYGADTAEGAGYAGQAGALYSKIAETTRPNVGKYAKADSKFNQAALKDYVAGVGDTSVESRPTQAGEQSGLPINSPLFAGNDRRKEKLLA